MGSHDCALVLIRGQIIFTSESGLRLDFSVDVDVVLKADERYALECERGGILLLVETSVLAPSDEDLRAR